MYIYILCLYVYDCLWAFAWNVAVWRFLMVSQVHFAEHCSKLHFVELCCRNPFFRFQLLHTASSGRLSYLEATSQFMTGSSDKQLLPAIWSGQPYGISETFETFQQIWTAPPIEMAFEALQNLLIVLQWLELLHPEDSWRRA